MSVVKNYYATHYGPRQLSGDEGGNRFDKIAPLWEEIRHPMRVLDMGCSAASVSEALLEMGHEVHGLDIMAEAVKRARSKGVLAEEWDLNNGLPHAKDPYDCILALDVLEHLFDPLMVLCQMHENLADDGYAIIMIPLHFDIRQRIYSLLGQGIVSYEHKDYSPDHEAWNYFHIRFFTLQEVRRMVRLAGYQIDKERFRPLYTQDLGKWIDTVLPPRLRWHMAQWFPQLLANGVMLRLRKVQAAHSKLTNARSQRAATT